MIKMIELASQMSGVEKYYSINLINSIDDNFLIVSNYFCNVLELYQFRIILYTKITLCLGRLKNFYFFN